jgi:hypothetical protein
MLAHAHNPSFISAWPPLMVAIALALMLGAVLIPTQSDKSEAAMQR